MNRLEDSVDQIASETGFSGVVRVDRDGAVQLAKAYGRAHRGHDVANAIDTRFGIASGTKGLTALTVVSLIEEGRLAPTTTARSLLGDDLPLIGDDVTVEHLLAHRSGIGDYLDEEAGFEVTEYVLPVPVHELATTEQYLRVLGGHPRKFAPDERFSYCNGGYVVLALLAERASGTRFHELVRQRVCEPAGVRDTEFLRSDELPGRAALGYLTVDGLRPRILAAQIERHVDAGRLRCRSVLPHRPRSGRPLDPHGAVQHHLWRLADRAPPRRAPHPVSHPGCSRRDQVLQTGASLGVAQRLEGAALELADALTGTPHHRADLLQGQWRARVQPEPQDQHLPLAFGKRAEHLSQRLPAERLGRQLTRIDGPLVLQEVLQLGAAVADRAVQRGDRVRAVLQTRHLLDRHVQLSGQLRVARVAAELGTQPGLAAAQPADPLIHVHRQTDRPRAAVSRPTGDRLADPPGRVGRELEALAPVELLDRAQQPEIALLDQVDQRQAGAGEAPRDRDHQTEIGLDHGPAGLLASSHRRRQRRPPRIASSQLPQPELGLQPGLVRLRKANLVLPGQQLVLPDFVQIQSEQVEVHRLTFDPRRHRAPLPATSPRRLRSRVQHRAKRARRLHGQRPVALPASGSLRLPANLD